MTLTTLEALHEAFSDFTNESAPPATNDIRYRRRTRWFNRARQDIASRLFLKELLKHDTLSIQSGTATYTLPEDFAKPNGLYVLTSADGSIVYTDPFEKRVTVAVARDLSTGRYQLTFTPTPTTDDEAPYWYFAAPAPLEEDSDPVLVNGEAVLAFALKQHYFISGPLDKFAESRDEYENIVAEVAERNEIPAPGTLPGMHNVLRARLGTTSEKSFYNGHSRRR